MKRFFKTLLGFSVLPLLAVIVLTGYYVYSDPFKVIYSYSDYSFPDIIPNRDAISTQSYIDRHEKHQYNSFIFGSSRTIGFRPSSWKKYLGETIRPFVFDASSESVTGICQKLRYLDKHHVKMENVLILLCHDCSFLNTIEDEGHLIIKHPEVSGKNKLQFHLSFLSSFFDNKFLWRYLAYKSTGTYKPWMRGYIEYRKISYDTLTNALNILDQEQEIMTDENAYYSKREAIFYARQKERTDSLPVIDDAGKKHLTEIRDLLTKNHADYKIVLSPLYEQVTYHPADRQFLDNTFGTRLYDFSGKNAFTDNRRNYYEASHFRPLVGDSILSFIYAGK